MRHTIPCSNGRIGLGDRVVADPRAYEGSHFPRPKRPGVVVGFQADGVLVNFGHKWSGKGPDYRRHGFTKADALAYLRT